MNKEYSGVYVKDGKYEFITSSYFTFRDNLKFIKHALTCDENIDKFRKIWAREGRDNPILDRLNLKLEDFDILLIHEYDIEKKSILTHYMFSSDLYKRHIFHKNMIEKYIEFLCDDISSYELSKE